MINKVERYIEILSEYYSQEDSESLVAEYLFDRLERLWKDMNTQQQKEARKQITEEARKNQQRP